MHIGSIQILCYIIKGICLSVNVGTLVGEEDVLETMLHQHGADYNNMSVCSEK